MKALNADSKCNNKDIFELKNPVRTDVGSLQTRKQISVTTDEIESPRKIQFTKPQLDFKTRNQGQ